MKPDCIIDIDLNDDNLYLDLQINTPSFYHFTDEYDLEVLTNIAEETGVDISSIVLKGLFQELKELGIVVSYEVETKICNEVNNFCSVLL